MGLGVYAIVPGEELPLVGLHNVTRAEIGKPVKIVMHRACRVRFRLNTIGLEEVAAKYNVELSGASRWCAAYLMLGDDARASRPLFTCSTAGDLEFLLPPGQYKVEAYGSHVVGARRGFEVKPGRRVQNLEPIDLPVNEAVKQGIFQYYHHIVQHDPQVGARGGDDDKKRFLLRHVKVTRLNGDTSGTRDIAYSPHGKWLATAHGHEGQTGQVKLWDTQNNASPRSLSVAEEEGGAVGVVFSPDGKILASPTGNPGNPKPPGTIILWDVAAQRVLQRLRGHTARILAVAFSPDGKTLASGGEDRSLRFWDVSAGRETARIDEAGGWIRSLAFLPDGKTLAVGAGFTLKLCDLATHSLHVVPESEMFLAESLVVSPDGKTLAAAGGTMRPDRLG